MKQGFTLLELLIVIAILAVLATVVVLILDPAETIRKARDVQRISDLSTLKTAIILFIGEEGAGKLIAGSGAGDGKECILGSDEGACVSTDDATITTGYNPTIDGHKSIELNYGWLPIDFTAMKSGAPISSLPIDQVNSADYYYRYATDGTDFIFDCKLESKYYTESVELEKTDGGSCSGVGAFKASYEVGTDLTMLESYCRPDSE